MRGTAKNMKFPRGPLPVDDLPSMMDAVIAKALADPLGFKKRAIMTGRTIENRLQHLERVWTPPPCETCWWWSATPIFVDDAGDYSRPSVCPDCGRRHEAPVEVHIVGMPVSVP